MNRHFSTFFLFLIFSFGISSSGNAQITPHEAILQMQKGINLGNTHEAPTEAGWNNPRAEEYYFDLYQEEGFQCVRIPVRWDNYTGKTPPYKVSESWLNRIEQVTDWGLERGLYIIINAHHDDWIKQNYSEANKARFDSIWTQISTHFKDKPEKLIFEILNEPHGLTKAQNDDMHARILSIIRKTNPTRLVIFQGHNWGGSDELLTAAIPDDDYVIGSFHSYDPYLFGLEGQGTWGTSYDYNQLENKFKAVSNWSLAHNIPVFLGEFGALKKCDYNSRMRHYRAYVENSYKYGFAFAAWDDGGDFRIMERQQRDWDEVKDILLHTNSLSPVPDAKIYQDSIIRVSWKIRTENHDSILVQRKLGTQRHYSDFVMLSPDSTQFFDMKPGVNSYYNYRIISHYNDSAGIYSQPVRVFFPEWTRPVRAPFLDTLMVIPGIVEAENFDKGGEGLSYHDKGTNNITGDYRPDDNVDIYDRMGDGYHVGNALPGEWMEYSVNVLTEGWYDVTVYTATFYGGGTFQIEFDTISSGAISVPTSYSALNTVPVSFKMYLYPGEQIMRFTVLSDPLFNIDKMAFELATGLETMKKEENIQILAFQNHNNELEIRTNSVGRFEYIVVSNITGQTMYSVNHPEHVTKISVSNLPSGIYIIQGFKNNKRYSVKTIIQNFQ
ncbi:cellulase family glycosylhydrolase [Mariniphaga sp.]|uniref:cellulase family glycosylhydrolase n=1 Tax=Mariniphaga sp. TaxID=1954475 RepID=UPI00356A6F30